MIDALARKATINQIVEAFEKVELRTRAAFAALVSAQCDINYELQVAERVVRIDASGYGYHDNFDDADRAVERMARDVWAIIVARLELRRMLSVTRWNQLEAKLSSDREKLPPITRESVADFVDFYLEHLGDMLEEAVGEVYDWLRPHKWDSTGHLKTNTHDGNVPKKVIVGGMLKPDFLDADKLRVNYGHAQQRLVALENVMSSLDGKGQIAKAYQAALQTALEAARSGELVETSYFKARGYGKNGRLHLEFKRADLLAKLNKIGGGRALRRENAA